MAKEKFHKIEIALIQLETAMILCMSNLFIPAITLASASEEILGKALEHEGKENFYQKSSKEIIKNLNLNLSVYQLGKQHINYCKNELKHFDFKDREILEADFKTEAISKTLAAMNNFISLTNRITPRSKEFYKYAGENLNLQVEDQSK